MNYKIEGLKGMNFDHDIGYSFPLFLFPPEKEREEEKENELAKIVIKKTHAFQTSLKNDIITKIVFLNSNERYIFFG